MDFEIAATLSPTTFALCLAVALFAGIVKGSIGFALPLIIVSGVSSLTDPKFAIAAMIFPVVVSNVVQTFRQGVGPAVAAVGEYWRYMTIVAITILLAAQLVPAIPSQVFYIVIGVPVTALTLIQLAGVRFFIPPHRRRLAEWIIGGISGTLGGLAGTWGPTTVLFLLATNTPKAKQMVVQGAMYGAGAIVLTAAHLKSGVVNASSAPFSLLLIVPSMIGMWIGFKIQDRLDQHLFRTLTLVVLCIAGVNLIRKGVFG